jgi:hypothetical protein
MPTMAAAVVPRTPWCLTPSTKAYNNQPMLRNRSMPLKLEKKYLLLLFSLLCAQRVNNNNVVAGNDARSHVWTICGGLDAIVPSYGLIVIFLFLGFRGGG